MPVTITRLKEIELTRSPYGCGLEVCEACYPVQYACENCLEAFALPIVNGEQFTCEACDWVNNDNLVRKSG
jgi:ligand-binding sensor protein